MGPHTELSHRNSPITLSTPKSRQIRVNPTHRAANLWKHKLVLRTSKISILPSKLVFFQPAHFSNILNLIYVFTQREFVP